jgi:hypothetical protein
MRSMQTFGSLRDPRPVNANGRALAEIEAR